MRLVCRRTQAYNWRHSLRFALFVLYRLVQNTANQNKAPILYKKQTNIIFESCLLSLLLDNPFNLLIILINVILPLLLHKHPLLPKQLNPLFLQLFHLLQRWSSFIITLAVPIIEYLVWLVLLMHEIVLTGLYRLLVRLLLDGLHEELVVIFCEDVVVADTEI